MMQNFFSRLLYRISHFLSGRYGIDALFMPILTVSCVLTLIGSFFHLGICRLLGMLLMLYGLFRVCSRNDSGRQKELSAYLTLKQKTESAIRLRRRMFRERHEKKYFKCPDCKVWLSVPKGKGKLQIRCTRCGHTFTRKA